MIKMTDAVGLPTAPTAATEHYKEFASGVRKGQCAFSLSGAGYTEEDLAGIPKELCSMSQGCGNVVALGDLQPGATVLDVGSGAGLDLLLSAKKVGPTGKVIGVDPVPEMRQLAQRFIDEAGAKNVEVRAGSADALPVEDNSVDVVLSNCVFALIKSKGATQELQRVLKPGATFVFSDIFVRDNYLWFFSILRFFLGPFVPMLKEFTLSRQGRIDSMKQAGFGSVAKLAESNFTREEVKNLLAETGVPVFLTGLGQKIIYRAELRVTKDAPARAAIPAVTAQPAAAPSAS